MEIKKADNKPTLLELEKGKKYATHTSITDTHPSHIGYVHMCDAMGT